MIGLYCNLFSRKCCPRYLLLKAGLGENIWWVVGVVFSIVWVSLAEPEGKGRPVIGRSVHEGRFCAELAESIGL